MAMKDWKKKMRLEPSHETLEQMTLRAVKEALERTDNNQLRAAQLLGINRNTLHKYYVRIKN